MGKALVVGNVGTAASGNEGNFGGLNTNATEVNSQAIATEAATFTLLGTRVVSGGSGTNTTTFRNNSAGGNNVVAYSGVSTGEDTTHSDAVSAGNPFGLAFTDTGTDPVYRWAKANVEFASGHGSFHIAANYNGVVCDTASATRLFTIQGTVTADGESAANRATLQWLVREYDTLEAFQVNVSANARVNDSVFAVEVNGSVVGTSITYAAGVSGIQTVTSMGISLSPGDLICVRITLLTGVEDLTLRSIGVTLKSSTGGSEIACASPGGTARAASSTPTYYTLGGLISQSDGTEANQAIRVGFAARCKNLRCYISANTYTGDCTLKLMVNGSAVITKTITAGATGWQENSTDTFDIDDNDVLSYEIDEGTANSITLHHIGVSFGAIAGGSTYTLDADAASYTYTPTDASLQQGYLIDAGVAAYAYTVTDADLLHGWLVDAGVASYTYTVTDADLLHGYVLDADAVSFTYTVTDVSLDYTPAGSTYTLNADAADFAVTVTDADLIYTQLNHYVLDAEAVSFSVAANDVDLQYSGQAASTPVPPPGGGKGRKHRRRILLADGRILIPANDQEYRRAVEQIIADFEKPEPAKPPKRRAEAKKVAQPKKPAPVKRLPKEFHKAVDNHTTGVLNYLAIQSAWEAYEAQQDEEAVEMLLMVS